MLSLPQEQLKQLLIQEGFVDASTFDSMYVEAERKRQNVVDVLISQGFLNKDYFYSLLAKTLGIDRIHIRSVDVDENVLKLLPEEIARQRRSIVFAREPSGMFHVAMEDPTDLETIDFLALKLGSSVKPFLATDEDLNRGFSLYEKKLTQDFKKVIEESIRESLRIKFGGSLEKAAEDLPIVAIVDNLLTYSLSSRASDMHVEILDDAILVRFRIDGVLHEIIRMPKEIHAAVVARLKILSGLRVDEHSKPQDGRFRYNSAGTMVDIRVSVMPTFYGEKK